MSEEITKHKGGRRPDAVVAAEMGISLEELRAQRKARLEAKVSQTAKPETKIVKKAAKPNVSKIEMYKLCIGFAEEIEKLKAQPEEMFAIVRELLK